MISSEKVLDTLNQVRVILAGAVATHVEWVPTSYEGTVYRNRDGADRIGVDEEATVSFGGGEVFQLERIIIDDEDAPYFKLRNCQLPGPGSPDGVLWEMANTDAVDGSYFAASTMRPVRFNKWKPSASRIEILARNISYVPRGIRIRVEGKKMVVVHDPSRHDDVIKTLAIAVTEAESRVRCSWQPRDYVNDFTIPARTPWCSVAFGDEVRVPGTGLPGIPETMSVVRGIERPFRVRRLIIESSVAQGVRVNSFLIGNVNVLPTSNAYPVDRFAEDTSSPIDIDQTFFETLHTIIISFGNDSDEDVRVRVIVRGEEEPPFGEVRAS